MSASRGKIIVIDSVDMTGKTEIAHALAKASGYTYFKNDAERKEFGTGSNYFVNVLRYGLTYFLSFLRQSKQGVIFDRCYPSEYVYAKAFNRETDWEVLRECDKEFARLGAVIIIPYRTSYEGIVDDSHPELIDSKRLAELERFYHDFATWTTVPVFWLNVDDENLEREIRDITGFLAKQNGGDW